MLQVSFCIPRIGRYVPSPPLSAVPAHLVTEKLRVSHTYPRPFEEGGEGKSPNLDEPGLLVMLCLLSYVASVECLNHSGKKGPKTLS